jgi:hypothetical protein
MVIIKNIIFFIYLDYFYRLTIGGSYPGAMSAWFRYKYPHLTVGALASSAVVNAIVNFTAFDE